MTPVHNKPPGKRIPRRLGWGASPRIGNLLAMSNLSEATCCGRKKHRKRISWLSTINWEFSNWGLKRGLCLDALIPNAKMPFSKIDVLDCQLPIQIIQAQGSQIISSYHLGFKFVMLQRFCLAHGGRDDLLGILDCMFRFFICWSLKLY